MNKVAILMGLGILFLWSNCWAEELAPNPNDKAYHIRLSKNEARGLYALLCKCQSKIYEVRQGPKKKRDSRIRTVLKRKHFTKLKKDQSPYECAWNVTFHLETTMQIRRVIRAVISSAGQSEFIQVRHLDGTTFITTQEIDMTWEPALKELLITISYPGCEIKNGYIEHGYYNIEASNKFTSTANMESKTKNNSWFLGGSAGFKASAGMYAENVVKIDVTITGSPFELRMGKVYLDRIHNRKTIIQFGQDWTSKALLDYCEMIQKAVGICSSTWAKYKTAVYILWGGGGSSSGEYKHSDCLMSYVENVFARIRWVVRPTYIDENPANITENDEVTAETAQAVGLGSRIRFVIDDLNLGKGSRAKAHYSVGYMSKLNWELDIEGFEEGFDIGSARPIQGVHSWKGVPFIIE